MTENLSPLDSSQQDPVNDAAIRPTNHEEKQQARTFLRERFIRAMLAMNGRMANFKMYENTNVSGVFGSCDREFINIYVKSLKTPFGTVNDALLRTNDMESLTIDEIDPSS